MERNELKQKINEEYEVFKNYILEQPKEEIFNRSAEIDTYYTYDDICEEIVELFDTDYSDSAD